MNIHEKLTAIQSELKVKKSRYNKFGKYYYRAAEDILEAIKPLAVKYKVTFTSDEEYIDAMVIKTTASITDVETGDSIPKSAIVGVEKAGGMALPQAFGSASSYGKKYAYGNLLLIDDTADADATQGTTNEKPRNKRTGFGKDAIKSTLDAGDPTDLGF